MAKWIIPRQRNARLKSLVLESSCIRLKHISSLSTCTLLIWRRLLIVSLERLWLAMTNMGYPLHIVNLLHCKQQASQCTTTRGPCWEGLPRLCDLTIPIKIMAEMITREALIPPPNSNMRKNYKFVICQWHYSVNKQSEVHSESELQEMANYVGQATRVCWLMCYSTCWQTFFRFIAKSLVNNLAKI